MSGPVFPPDFSVLSHVAPQLAETFVTVASDVALLLDHEGVIRKVALAAQDPVAPSPEAWLNRPWVDTATAETRRKVELLLQEVTASGVTRRREVSHPSPSGIAIPVAWTAVRLGDGGPVLAVGRDLRAIADIQRRFLDAQQELERAYWRRRQVESRYRLLFHVATDGVLVLDARRQRIVDANPAAARMFDLPIEQLIGRPATVGIDPAGRAAVDELLVTARVTLQPGELRVRLLARRALANLSVAPFGSEEGQLLMLRVHAVDADEELAETGARLVRLVERTPDAVVVTDAEGRVRMVNPAGLDLLQVPDEAHVLGRLLTEWVGADGELAPLLTAARRFGIAPRQACSLNGTHGAAVRVEVAAVLLPDGEHDAIGLTIRALGPTPNVGARVRYGDLPDMGALAGSGEPIARAIERLALQLGTLDLPALVHEVGAYAERHFLSAALVAAGGAVERAARLLGIGVDRMAERLRRYRIVVPEDGGAASGSDASSGSGHRQPDEP